MDKTKTYENEVIGKIKAFLKKERLRDTAIGLLKTISLIVFVFMLLSFIESFAWFDSTIRKILIILFLLISLTAASLWLLKPLLIYLKSSTWYEINNTANFIGQKYPEVKDNLLNSLQLLHNKNNGESNELIEAAFLKVYKQVSKFNFNDFINYSRLKKTVKVFSSIFIFSVIVYFAFPFYNNAVYRLLNFNKEFTKPAEFSLEVFPGNSQLKKGNNIQIKVLAKGKAPKSIILSTKNKSQTEFTNHQIFLDSNNYYSINLRNIKNSFIYFAHGNNVKTNHYKIEVISPPMINNFMLSLIPPRYSGQPALEQENNGNITALLGTKINVKIRANKTIPKAKIVFKDSSTIILTSNEKEAIGYFYVKNNNSYYFQIEDSNGNKNETPIKYSITTLEDLYPEIVVTSPEQNSLLPNNDIVSIDYAIKDDYGFSNMLLLYKVNSRDELVENNEYITVELSFDKSILEQSQYYNWDASRLNLKENEVVTFFLEVYDNDNISGPKSTKSKIYKFRVPSIDEFFAQSDIVQDNAIKDITKTMKETEELNKELEQMQDELKQNKKKIDWNEKENIDEALNKFEKIKNKMSEVKEKLKDMQKELMQNNLLSEETMKKYNELQDLMDKLSSDEMKKAMEQMQKSLQDLMRDKIQKSLENFSMNEKMFQKSIERTLNLLKKIQIEQKMDEVIKRTEKIIEDLEKQSSETEKNEGNKSEETKNQLTKEQENIDKQLKKLESEMQKLSEKMKDVKDMPNEKMDELNKKMDDQKNNELSKKAMEKLNKQNFEQSLKMQQKLSQNMNSMKNELQQMQQQMQQQSQQMVMQDMLKAIDNIIDLSKEQESLKKTTDNFLSQPKSLPQKAEDQMELKQNLDKILKQLGDLSQKTFAISPEMGKSLGDARANMNNALAGLQSKNGQKSTFNQSEAMKNLNEAASMLQNSLQAMMQGGGQGGGMMSLMQQLQQMAQQQMGLNGLTKMMQKGQLTMQQQAQLQRLAQEQGSIQKSLQELNKEARESGESKKIAANLDKILEDMQEVISGFNSQKIDDELIKKQDKILSKLLDAQRSINERDFEEKREARTGKEFNLQSPDGLILGDEKSQDLLREELLKAVQEGYSKDYQDLIRRYFESLSNSAKKN